MKWFANFVTVGELFFLPMLDAVELIDWSFIFETAFGFCFAGMNRTRLWIFLHVIGKDSKEKNEVKEFSYFLAPMQEKIMKGLCQKVVVKSILELTRKDVVEFIEESKSLNMDTSTC